MLFSHLSVAVAPRNWWKIALFAVCLLFFLDRGPYRAIRYSTTGDFSTVYAAARCWMHGANPYERASLKNELATSGAPASIQRDQDINPSVYLPSAMPWVAPFAALRWKAANASWILLLIILFVLSVRALIAHSGLMGPQKWFAWGAALLFSPTYVGIYDGNPGVLAIGLATLSVCLAADSSLVASGIVLGIALCFKPQIAICAFCVLALRKCWKPQALAVGLFAAAAMLGVAIVSHAGHDWWWQSEQHNLAISFVPGGQSDPSPVSPVAWQLLNTQALAGYLFSNRRAMNVCVWIIAGCLALVYLWRRKPIDYWRDAAFFSALVLLPTYHRYYDAQLLLLLLPLLVQSARSGNRRLVLTTGFLLLILALPIQSVFARMLGERATIPSFRQFVLLRNQPAALLLLAAVLSF